MSFPVFTPSLKAFSISFETTDVASKSLTGVIPNSAGKVNQDVCFHFCIDRFVCCGVLDGHGKKGHELNSFLRSYIPKILKEKFLQRAENGSSVEQILVETFEESHHAARMDNVVPAGRSGTTCVVTIIDLESAKVYTGNVGDSRSIIGIQQQNSGSWTIYPLSQETTTARKQERERIERGEGRIDDAGNVWYGPVGIAMTRALGDSVMKRAGIIPTPELTTLNLREKIDAESEMVKGLIVLGSDGIFDVLSNENAIAFLDDSLLRESSSLEESCSGLVELCRKRWQNDLPLEVSIDDTTLVVLSFGLVLGE